MNRAVSGRALGEPIQTGDLRSSPGNFSSPRTFANNVACKRAEEPLRQGPFLEKCPALGGRIQVVVDLAQVLISIGSSELSALRTSLVTPAFLRYENSTELPAPSRDPATVLDR
jgi:hypothetical protein